MKMKKIITGLTLFLCFSFSIVKAEAQSTQKFEGVWGCKFGMSSEEVYEILSAKFNITREQFEQRNGYGSTTELYDVNGLDHVIPSAKTIDGKGSFENFIGNLSGVTYCGIPVEYICLEFIDNKFVGIDLAISGDKTIIKNAAEYIISTFNFKYKGVAQIHSAIKIYTSGSIQFVDNSCFYFFDLNIRDKARKEAIEQRNKKFSEDL